MTKARKQQICLKATPYYHCISRCVRRAFLCGKDRVTRRSFDHRKQWVVDYLKSQAEVFCIEICAYAVMSNHYHTVLYVNTEKAEQLAPHEVLMRWKKLFSLPDVAEKFLNEDSLSLSEQNEVEDYVSLIKNRLTDISWFMRCLNENIARKANKEDRCKGRFWEGRFKSQALLDDAALLTCMTYVDLNPVRAGLSKTLETSDFTSVQDRIRQLKAGKCQKKNSLLHLKSNKMAAPERRVAPGKKTQQRKSTQPSVLSDLTLESYLELVDWTGRIIRDKKGSIPQKVPPILSQMKIDSLTWKQAMQPRGKFLYAALGSVKNMQNFARNIKQQWMHGIILCKQLFVAG